MIRKKTYGIISLFAVIAVLVVGCSSGGGSQPTFVDGVRTNPDYGDIINITVAKPDTTLLDCVVYVDTDTDVVCDWEHVSKNGEATSVDEPDTFVFNSFLNTEGPENSICVVAKYRKSGTGIDCEF